MPNTEVGSGEIVTPDLIATASTPMQTPEPMKPREVESRASAYIAQGKFNRTLTLPSTGTHGELSVTYAVGGLDRADAPTLLFIGGMMGGRLLASMADYIGMKRGMRIVVTDRPGLGGSTPVEPSLRLPVWLETVPVLMRTINAQYVSICAHSCGVIYALNTIYSMPWILPPSNRKLYLLAPWVLPEQSGKTFLSISSYLPSAMFNGFDNIIRLVNSTVMPAMQFSSVVSGAVSAPLSKTSEEGSTNSESRIKKHERDDLCWEYCGVSAVENAARSKVLMKRVFSESISGSNHEALLLMQKDVAGSWGPCADYQNYAEALEVKLKEYSHHTEREEGGSIDASASVAGLNISATHQRFGFKVFWAEKDMLIGKKGEKYFDGCFSRFTRDGQSSNGEHESSISYESETIADTDHDTLCFPQYGAISKILEDIFMKWGE